MRDPAPTPAASRLRRLAQAEALGRAELAATLFERHHASLKRTALRFSAEPADAEDALQRAAEIMVRRGPSSPAEGNPLAWLHVVVRNEALAVSRCLRRRSARGFGAGAQALDPDRHGSAAADPESAADRRERIAAAAESLARLKPQERRAIALQAAGCSYAEIQAITGWTYTKVNRCLAEGRARLASVA